MIINNICEDTKKEFLGEEANRGIVLYNGEVFYIEDGEEEGQSEYHFYQFVNEDVYELKYDKGKLVHKVKIENKVLTDDMKNVLAKNIERFGFDLSLDSEDEDEDEDDLDLDLGLDLEGVNRPRYYDEDEEDLDLDLGFEDEDEDDSVLLEQVESYKEMVENYENIISLQEQIIEELKQVRKVK